MRRAIVLWAIAGLAMVVAACGADDSIGENGGANNGSANNGSDEARAAECGAYCDNMMANCTGDNLVFETRDACLATCDGYPGNGAEGDADGDTRQCRLYHSGATADDAAMHCPHASPSGAGVCGAWCDAYCRIVMSACTATNGQFTSAADCLSACSEFGQEGAYNDADGDTVQCRVYHGGAAVADPATHCSHAGASGGGVCVGGAPAGYCERYEAACGAWSGDVDCETWWASAPAGGPDDTFGASQGCYEYHLGAAVADPDAHCVHARGEEVCVGTSPTQFCADYTAACGEMEGCAAWFSGALAGTDGDADGPTRGCYVYHLGAAADDADTHCEHARGDAVCNFCDLYEATCGTFPGDCAAWWQGAPVGTDADTEGATQGCYLYHLRAAAEDPDSHCVHARGDEVCVD
jgi:hypothetical protein